MPVSIAQTTDVSARLGRDFNDDAESLKVQTLLDDAELEIKHRIPKLLDMVMAGELDEDVVIMVEAKAVQRVMANPEGYTQESDGNYSYELNMSVASGLLEILPKEWDLLGIRQGAFMIRPYQEPAEIRLMPEFWFTL